MRSGLGKIMCKINETNSESDSSPRRCSAVQTHINGEKATKQLESADDDVRPRGRSDFADGDTRHSENDRENEVAKHT